MDSAKVVAVFINITGISFLVLLCGIIVWNMMRRICKKNETEDE